MRRELLVVDDDRATCNLLELGLSDAGYAVTSVTSAEGALERLTERDFEVVLTDLNMPGMGGIELCKQIVERRPDVPVIVLTAFGSLETAISAIRAGAFDFVTKPFELDAVIVAVERAAKTRELRDEVRRLRAMVGSTSTFPGLIGTSAAMTRLIPLLERIAATDTSVLLTGESGTGKEVVARALHESGSRKGKPFIAINCAALPAQLLEAELFGHVRGAFTDAKTARSGLFVEASGGTLFLDEVGEMPLELQPKLLRALEQRTVRPLGASVEVPFDMRLIAATNRDLETMIESGRFRDDLYYRLAVITVGLPPLRARGMDILLLGQRFLDELVETTGRSPMGISSGAAAKLLAYAWPGNVRELRNCIERAVTLSRHDRILVDDLPDKIRDHSGRQDAAPVPFQSEEPLVPLEEIERRYVLKVLEAVQGNKSLAAETLGLNRKTLYRKLAAWGVRD